MLRCAQFITCLFHCAGPVTAGVMILKEFKLRIFVLTLVILITSSAYSCSIPRDGHKVVNYDIEFLGECTSLECEEHKRILKLRADIRHPNCVAEVYFEGKQSVIFITEVECKNVPTHFIGSSNKEYCYEPRWFKLVNHNNQSQQDK